MIYPPPHYSLDHSAHVTTFRLWRVVRSAKPWPCPPSRNADDFEFDVEQERINGYAYD